MAYENDLNLNLKATELRLGLPGTEEEEENDEKAVQSVVKTNNKRPLTETSKECGSKTSDAAPPSK